jgi:hypothetical protein
MTEPMELPFEASLLLPFIIAWREAPDASDEKVRLAYVVEAMKPHDSAFDADKAKGAMEALEMRMESLMRPVQIPPRHFCPTDAACVCCGTASHLSSSSRAAMMHAA